LIEIGFQADFGICFPQSRPRRGAFILPACKSKAPSQAESGPVSGNNLELTFTYGSEKEKWINEVTAEFNRGDHRTTAGAASMSVQLPQGREGRSMRSWKAAVNPASVVIAMWKPMAEAEYPCFYDRLSPDAKRLSECGRRRPCSWAVLGWASGAWSNWA